MDAPRAWAALELRHLLALEAIAGHGTFHAAAAHLGYSQPAISQQVATLERIVGTTLVERLGGSRPVRLTAAGAVLLEHGRGAFGHLATAQARIAALEHGTSGRVRAGAFQSVGSIVLPAVLARLAQEAPGVEVELTQTTADGELLDLLARGELDVAFVMPPVPDGPYATEELYADPFVAVVRDDSPLGRSGPVALEQLVEEPLITAASCRSLGRVEAHMRERGLAPRVAHRSDDNGTALGLVAERAGVALVPRLSAAAGGEGLRVVDIADPLPARRVALCRRSDRPVPDAVRTFACEVAATCRRLGLGGDPVAASATC